ncbi:tape measure protein [Devosia sp. YIM 151766]|uniref:tape measure protein n=1 Tax=Devosia sp. YIM 151766 TaxID=3017325 RepID=UPI00255C2941|nr:tape measure protein [Devosia sp. YIM 151766]WIY54158.1 tape measure protein [Devosia sp. YIM 151766]
MTELASLGLSIRSDGVVVATDRLNKFSGAGERAEGVAGSLVKAATRVGVALAGAFSIAALGGYADEWSDLQSQVGAAIKDMDAAGGLMARLGQMARDSYSPLEKTVTTYARNAAVLRDLGKNADQAADFSEALNHALVTTATKGQDADVVLNALSRSISTGKLRAMEYETIMSRSPRVLEAVAEAMGTTVTGLRQLAVDGKVTGDVIVDGLIGSLEDLRKEAGEMPATLADAGTIWRNTIMEIVGRMDQAANSSGSLAEKLIEMADAVRAGADGFIQFAVVVSENFERMVYWGSAYITMMGVNYVASVGLATVATAAMSAALAGLRLAIAGTGIGVLAIILGDVALKLWDSATATDGLADSIDNVGGKANGFFTFMWNGAEALAVTFDWLTTGIAAGFMGAFATIYENYANLINGIRAGFRAIGIADMIGMSEGGDMDPKWATGVHNSLTQDAASAGRLAAEKWAVAFGKQLDMDTGSFPTMDEMKRIFEIGGDAGSGMGSGTSTSLSKEAQKQADAYAKLVRGAHEFIAAQTLEQQALGMTAEAAARMRYEQDLLNKAANDNIKLTPAMRSELAMLAEQMAATEAQTKMLTQAANDNAALWGSVQDGVSGVLKTWARGGDILDTISDKLLGIGDMLIDMAVRNLFQNAFGGGMGGGGFNLMGLFGVPSFDGGGWTGDGARSGGMDGKGGYLAMVHPKERIVDTTRSGGQSDGGRTVLEVRLSPELLAQLLQEAAGQSVQITRGMVEPVSKAVDQMAQQQRYG